MPDQNKPFVVTDRRKFSLDGTPRPDADRESDESRTQPATSLPEGTAAAPVADSAPDSVATPEPEPDFETEADPDAPPPPTQAEMDQASVAYQQTSDRLDTAVRAANPGMDHPPAMSFEAIVQSIFMTSLMQLGATAPEGQQPRIDLMGARQSIDMLGILADRTKGNLSLKESQFLDNALFELRMGFLEVTQALARSAGNRPGGPGGPTGAGGGPGRPSIIR